MKVDFTSISSLVDPVTTALLRGQLSPGSTLSIAISSKPNNLLDLFTLGRLLAFVDELRNFHHINVEFTFPHAKNLFNLTSLGFFDYCRANDLRCVHLSSRQLQLLELPDSAKTRSGTPISGKRYWRCLIPLHKTKFEPVQTEAEITSTANQLIKTLSVNLERSLNEVGIDYESAGLELSRVLFTLVKELLTNTLEHSYAHELLFAMTISKETAPASRPHRSGFIPTAGQDKFEILTMDFGRGIYKSVLSTLTGKESNIEDQYFSLSPWSPSLELYRAKEESLLSTIFNGNLVIRKGRKSEGLYEIGATVSWFDGMLNLHTGRTELQLASLDKSEVTATYRRRARPYYLPGVIASAVLPSRHLKISSLKRFFQSATISNSTQTVPCKLYRLPYAPAGLFGGMSMMKIRRRSEIDAGRILAEYNSQATMAESDTNVFEINLGLADNIDIDFLDNLIQELGKLLDPSDSRNQRFLKLVFCNVPRQIVHALKRRNCNSILMLNQMFCTLLDEADEPHFLGLPRVSTGMIDLEELLLQLYHGKRTLEREKLQGSELRVTPKVLDEFETLLDRTNGSAFFVDREVDCTKFIAYDLLGALSTNRAHHLLALESVRLSEGDDAIFKLRNGTYVDALFDFALFWGDTNRLIDCAKYLLSLSGFPAIDSIVAFMNNGDRLAAAIQRITKTPELVIVDPHNPETWHTINIEGDSILVVDALYAGDDSGGYIKRFIELSDRPESHIGVRKIFAFCDFREIAGHNLTGGDEPARAPFVTVQVVAAPLPPTLTFPRRIASPPEHCNILRNFEHYVLSKPKVARMPAPEAPTSATWKSFEYSPIELSTEFWQNVAATGVIASERTGREERNVLFYENNERLIRHPRMRRIVNDYVADFVKNVLNLKIEVILHPNHAVGSYLAQLVAVQLPSTPLQLSLNQRSYGGPIEVTPDDYTYYHDRIEELRRVRFASAPRCIIVDDSVLSGSSLVTMLGVAAGLGLRPVGILVLLSRLTPEVSSAIALLPLRFSYLYRLHMPILSHDKSPDLRLERLNREIGLETNSYFGYMWALNLASQDSHFLHREPLLEELPISGLRVRSLPLIKGSHMETYQLEQILIRLLLHPDSNILPFSIRIAIAYNFLEQLVREDAFWALLIELVSTDMANCLCSYNSIFVSKLIYILAFSRYIYPYEIYSRFQDLCCKLVVDGFSSGKWITFESLISECLMALGIVGSEKLLTAAAVSIGPILNHALTPLVSANGDCPINVDSGEVQNMVRATDPARNIIGAFAWSINVLIAQKGQSIVDNASVQQVVDSIKSLSISVEAQLLVIDTLEPVINASADLRAMLSIASWDADDQFLDELASDSEDNIMLRYLKEAPGYTCTLATILRICKADTILLYSKNASDEEFFLHVFETRDDRRAHEDLSAEHLREQYLIPGIRHRIREGLFFSSSDRAVASLLDVFVQGARHKWLMGAPVNIGEYGAMQYYVILGYKNLPATTVLQLTAYYYWLKCEAILRDVLPAIHLRHVGSSTAWNALVQSLAPIHPVRLGTDQDEPIGSRRQVLRHAMALVDVGDLLRRAVRMASERVFRLPAILDRVEVVGRTLAERVQEALRTHSSPEGYVFPLEAELWPVRVVSGPPPPPLADVYCSFPMALLEFILYECLCNSLSYYRTQISVSLEFLEHYKGDRFAVALSVSNDIHGSKKGMRQEDSLGIAACSTAAEAAEGSFRASELDDGNTWVAEAILPAFRVPAKLVRQIHEYIG
jgi:hypothetical protein